MLLVCFPSFVEPCLINYFHHSHFFFPILCFSNIFLAFPLHISAAFMWSCILASVILPRQLYDLNCIERSIFWKNPISCCFFHVRKLNCDSFETVWNSRVKTVSQKAAKHDNCSDKDIAVVSIFPERLSRCFHSLTKHYAAVWIQEFASFSCAKEPLALEFIK